MKVSLSPDSNKQGFGNVLGRGLKIQLPPLLSGSEAIFLPYEEILVPADQDLTNMAFPNISPAMFFMNGPEEFFYRDEPCAVRDESELIGSMCQNVGQKTA
jgi:hypothetical protein